jgi:2-oxoglutarate ferredoxin oxidoreductase subunit alpha
MNVLKNAKMTICVENNATSQFAHFIKAETGYTFNRLINRYDGRPFSVESLIGEINAFNR